MVNHARTLLMNVTAPIKQYTAYPGDAIIDPGFIEVKLPAELNTVRNILFGAAPDRIMRNYRCQQFLALIKASPLAEHLYRFDVREAINENTDFLNRDVFQPIVTQLSGAVDDRLIVNGFPAAPDSSGYTRHVYLVEIVTTSSIRIARQTPAPASTMITDFEVNGRIKLGNSGFFGRVTTDNPGASWLFEVINEPQKDLGVISNDLTRISETTTNALFGVENTEPYKTYKNAWLMAPDLPTRLSGFLLALISRTEERRVNRG